MCVNDAKEKGQEPDGIAGLRKELLQDGENLTKRKMQERKRENHEQRKVP